MVGSNDCSQLENQDIGYSKLANLDPQYGLCKYLCYSTTPSSLITDFLGYCCETETSLLLFQTFTDSSFVPPLIYAIMGSSRDIAIGPVAVVSLLLGTLLRNEIDPNTNPVDYRRLAFTATFFAGITQATLGILR